MNFEEWLRANCFKAPPKHSVDLARGAWKAALKEGRDLQKERDADFVNDEGEFDLAERIRNQEE